VAAASILARAEFVRRLERLGENVGMTLPKGAGPQVLETARELVRSRGPEVLAKTAKLHFKTTSRIIGPESGRSASG
jgi:ribonuclease HIII